MRLILIAAICPLLYAQFPNRPAAQPPAGFAFGVPARSQSAARPPTPPTPIGLRTYPSGFTGINPGALPSRSSSRRGDRRVVPVIGYFPLYYPYGDYSYSSYSPYQFAPPDDSSAQQGADLTANLLGDQIQRLSAQVDQLRMSQQQAPPLPPENVSQPPQDAPPVAPITVVLRDGQQLQVRSFAVMDQVFWDFSQQPAKRIPVSNIDVAASTKATEAAGGEFPILN